MENNSLNFIVVPQATSTNTLVREMDPPHGTAVHAIAQTAGRGQRGNTWESQPGANVTLSVILRPEAIPADNQFVISQVAAVATASLVSRYFADAGVKSDDVAVKWPNDIYVGNKKIAGILIENSVAGKSLTASIIGVGLNVNQLRFYSDAPNPVSIANLTDLIYDPVMVARELAESILDYYDRSLHSGGTDAVDSRYRSMLYRREGIHRWREAGSGREFNAGIHGIDSYGRLLLIEENSAEPLKFSFKEIIYL